MACARNLGLSTMPLVCVNTNGFYNSFRDILQRAWEDRLTKLRPEQIIHFVDTPEEAIRWVERVCQNHDFGKTVGTTKSDRDVLRHSSALGNPSTKPKKLANSDKVEFDKWFGVVLVFVVGFISGSAPFMDQNWAYEE